MKLLREPLVHFAVAGALLFGAYAWLNRGDPGGAGADRTLRISEREVAWLAETWTRQWQRPPTERELQGLVTDYLKEELLAREARELELDRDDTVVRRRLAQKMGFLLEDTARLAEPTDADLRTRFEADRSRFDEPARTSFEQRFFSRERRGEGAGADAERALARLAAGDAGAASGDPSLLPAALADADEREIASQFGAELARAVIGIEPGGWSGPIESGFGLHLVRVTARRPPTARPFEAVRDELVGEWRREREAAAKEDHFAGLLRKYDVQVAESVRPLLGPALVGLGGVAP